MFRNYIKLIITFFSLILLGLTISNAQLAEEDFKVFVTPENPKNGETFLVFLDEYNTELTKSDISWSLNDKLISKGFGKISQKFVMSDTPSKVTISITMPSGKTYTKSKIFTPRSISLIWEGLDSYTPYWYEGKRLSTRGDKIRVYAITSISNGTSTIKDSDINFTWEMNDEILKGSGLGANYIDINVDEYQDSDNEIKVTASPRLSSDTVTDTVIIKTTDPEVAIYKVDGGILRKQFALGSAYQGIPGEIISITTVPYFFNSKDTLSFDWAINNKKDSSNGPNKSFKLGETSGITSISIAIENAKKLFQSAKSELLIKY